MSVVQIALAGYAVWFCLAHCARWASRAGAALQRVYAASFSLVAKVSELRARVEHLEQVHAKLLDESAEHQRQIAALTSGGPYRGTLLPPAPDLIPNDEGEERA